MSSFSRLYQRRVFPWLNDLVCSEPAIAQLRAETLATATGQVIEIGFGTGLNLPHYPAGVSELVAVEPNAGMVDRSGARLRAAAFPVRIVNGSAEALPLRDAAFDTAVSTLTLCSVADPALALAELRRVLRPGGRLLLLEHGLAPEPGVARWQHRLDGLQQVLACGCHLVRPMAALVAAQGFEMQQLRAFYLAGVPRPHGWMTLAEAVSTD